MKNPFKKSEQATAQSIPEASINNDPVRQAAEAVKKRTGGRPTVDEMYDEINRATGAAPSTSEPSSFVTEDDRRLFRDCARTATILIDALATNAVQGWMIKAGYLEAKMEDKFIEYSAKVPMKADMREQFVGSATALAEKYGFVKVGPEAAFGLCLGAYLYSLMDLRKTIIQNAPRKPEPDNVENVL